MAGKIRIELNRAGIIAALTAPGVRADLLRRGNAAAALARANGGGAYMVTARTGRTRVRVSVITANDTARRAEATGRALTRALDAARRG
jgi:hypothetical protein